MNVLNKVRSGISDILNLGLGKFDIELTFKKYVVKGPITIDLRKNELGITPVDVLKFSTQRHIQYLLDVPADRICASWLLDVWIKTMILWGKEDSTMEIEKRPSYLCLKEHFQTCQPKNVAELLDLNLTNVEIVPNYDYLKLPPLYTVYPWSTQSPQSRYEYCLEIMKLEFEENGGYNYNFKSDGWKSFGPVSERMVKVEYERLITAYDSIKKNGYLGKFGYSGIILFKKNNDYLFSVLGGWHRTAAMLALNYQYIPVFVSNQFTPIVNKEEYRSWPQVISNLFTAEQAKEIFDHRFQPLKLDNLFASNHNNS